MPIEILDIIVIVVVLISAILAMVRGFVREILSVASWFVAGLAAYFLHTSLLPLVSPYISNEQVATIVAVAIVFFIVLIVASYLTMKFSDWVIDSRIGASDRAVGFLWGVFRALVILVVALRFFEVMVPKPPAWVAQARTKPLLDEGGVILVSLLPDELRKFFDQKRPSDDDSPDVPGESSEPPASPAIAPANPTTGSINTPSINDAGVERIINNDAANPLRPGN